MSSLEVPQKKINEKHIEIIMQYLSDIKSGKLAGSNNIAIATVTLLKQIIETTEAFELCRVIREVGIQIHRSLPQEYTSVNTVLRILKSIREEYKVYGQVSGTSSLQGMAKASSGHAHNPIEPDLRVLLLDYIAELQSELDYTAISICLTAWKHIHDDELILTYGESRLAEQFLKSCKKRYRLIVVEECMAKKSHEMAARVSAAGVTVTVISNSSIYCIMSRVSKVVVGVNMVQISGIIACSGTQAVMMAAKHYRVPVLALVPLYKLSPAPVSSTSSFTTNTMLYDNLDSVHVYTPKYDYMPLDYVTLFITNLGNVPPSYIYRLMSELYDSSDFSMFGNDYC